MSKTCLRELLEQVPKSYMECEPATHALLEALVKIVGGLVETVYPVRTPEFWQRRCRNAEHELALALTLCDQAKAEIEGLRKERDEAVRQLQEKPADDDEAAEQAHTETLLNALDETWGI